MFEIHIVLLVAFSQDYKIIFDSAFEPHPTLENKPFKVTIFILYTEER